MGILVPKSAITEIYQSPHGITITALNWEREDFAGGMLNEPRDHFFSAQGRETTNDNIRDFAPGPWLI